MKQLIVKCTWLGLLGTALILAACGGGGGGGGGGGVTHLSYTGNTDPAAINGSNAKAIGASVTEGAAEAVGSETAGDSNPFAASINLSNSNSPLTRKLAEIGLQVLHDAQSSNLPVGVTYSWDQLNTEIGDTIFCDGSVSISDALFNGNSESGTITYNNLCFDIGYLGTGKTGELFINGSMTISVSGTTETVTLTNMSATYAGETFTFSGTEVCDTVTFECSTLYVGSDGETYMASNVSVFGDSVSGYYVSATFFDPTYGAVTVTTDVANPIIFNNCPGGVPESGVLNFESTDGISSGTITFIGCANYSIDYDDGLGNFDSAGTIAGTW